MDRVGSRGFRRGLREGWGGVLGETGWQGGEIERRGTAAAGGARDTLGFVCICRGDLVIL